MAEASDFTCRLSLISPTSKIKTIGCKYSFLKCTFLSQLLRDVDSDHMILSFVWDCSLCGMVECRNKLYCREI